MARATFRWMSAFSKTQVDRAGRALADRIRATGGAGGIADEADAAAQAVDWWGSEALRIVDWWRFEHQSALSTVAAGLFRYASEEGDPIVAQRLKRVPTIAGKLHREGKMRLSQMEDVGGARAVLPDQEAAYRVARQLKRNWTITRFRDYVQEPKSDGYRALHLVNRHRGRLIEIQLRTPLQDGWANAVEAATQRFPGLKIGGGPVVLREFFISASEFSSVLDGAIEVPSMARLLEIQSAIDRADTFLAELPDEP